MTTTDAEQTRGRSGAASSLAGSDAALRDDLLRVIEGRVAPAFYFQPIADLRSAAVAGYEALVRLPVRAGLSPFACIQAAIRLGLQVPLETVLVRHALKARSDLPSNSFLSVNVSPAFLCSKAWEQLEAEDADLSRIVIEVTESEYIEDYDRIRKRAGNIVARGGMVAIDDAGAGYASLRHILELRPNFIKLDGALVSNCDVDRAKATMIEVLGAAADRMDAWVITECVETAAELQELIRLGVPLAQGYFLGRPGPSMRDLTDEARQAIKGLGRHRAEELDLLLYSQVCPEASSRAQAMAMLRPECKVVAVTDTWGRPVELAQWEPVAPARVHGSFLRCQISCSPREALQRALTRELACRFDPILLINAEGRLQGMVALDRLMLAVLAEP